MTEPEFPGYTPAQLRKIIRLLELASDGRVLDPVSVEGELVGILHAVGLADDGSEEALAWREFAAADPSHQQLRDDYRRMADAPDPLAMARINLSHYPNFVVHVRRRLLPKGRLDPQTTRLSVRTLEWADLTESQQTAVREIARDLSRHHGYRVRRGAPQKEKLDTAMQLLAEQFLEWTGRDNANWYHLPHSVGSRFIRFASAALLPVAKFEASPRALSNRWLRLVRPIREAGQGFDDETSEF